MIPTMRKGKREKAHFTILYDYFRVKRRIWTSAASMCTLHSYFLFYFVCYSEMAWKKRDAQRCQLMTMEKPNYVKTLKLGCDCNVVS